MIQFEINVFQMGWNHQLDPIYIWICQFVVGIFWGFTVFTGTRPHVLEQLNATSRQVSKIPFTLEEEVRNKNGSHDWKIPHKTKTSINTINCVGTDILWKNQRQNVDPHFAWRESSPSIFDQMMLIRISRRYTLMVLFLRKSQELVKGRMT